MYKILMNFVNRAFTKNVKRTDAVLDVSLQNQVERQKRQIEMCFSLLFELCEKQDKDFANFVQSKNNEYIKDLQVTGFKRYE